MNSVPRSAALAVLFPAALDFLRDGVCIAIIANGLIGISLVWDKVLLRQPETTNLVSGVRYAIIFLGAYGLTRLYPRWLEENFRGWTLAGKSLATLLIVAGLVFLGLSGKGQDSAARLLAPASRNRSLASSLATHKSHLWRGRPRPRGECRRLFWASKDVLAA